MAQNEYVLFKGKLKLGVPFLDGYKGDPHYVIVSEDSSGKEFRIVTNVKSDSSLTGAAGYLVLYAWNQYFDHPLTADLQKLSAGVSTSGFPKLDYVHDPRLVDLSTMRPIPLDTETEHNDINALLNEMLKLDMSAAPVEFVYPTPGYSDNRRGWKPTTDVTIYGFGFLFEPQKDGLHETHMNQGNPKPQSGSKMKDHSSENGTFQDGAVIVEVGGKFQALFVAFQTQLVPTDNRGRPIPGTSHPILATV
ncbi:YukJ family protein [Paraburkholderia dipogonis]|nr:YukJ family protein [Paraburkholderia dipogonis]